MVYVFKITPMGEGTHAGEMGSILWILKGANNLLLHQPPFCMVSF